MTYDDLLNNISDYMSIISTLVSLDVLPFESILFLIDMSYYDTYMIEDIKSVAYEALEALNEQKEKEKERKQAKKIESGEGKKKKGRVA